MYLCRFPFRLLGVFETCLILVRFNIIISSSPVKSSFKEIQGMMNLQSLGYVNESKTNSAFIIGQKAVEKAITEFLVFSETPETGRQKREVATSTPDLCQDASIDATTITEDGTFYVFKGDYYWEITGMDDTRIADGYPRKISDDWEGLPGNLDAALTWADGNSFFFKESEYWKFRNKKRESGYPKEISVGFSGIPNNVDAALLWGGNGQTYFFKGSGYWRYKYFDDPSDSVSYPLPISTWEGLSNNIDAALPWPNNQTYFFQGKNYYRFDNKISSVVKNDPVEPYPRSSAVWWFGCPKGYTSSSEDDFISSSTQNPMEDDYVESFEIWDDGDDLTSPSSPSDRPDTNSAASSCASLLLSLLMVAIL